MRLQRETIGRAALALLNEAGLDGLTVRRLAERLGVQNPALYWHFKSKQDVLRYVAELMLTDAFASLALPADPEQWEAWLTTLATSYRGALLSVRDGARVLAEADLRRSPLLADLETGIQLLQEASFSRETGLTGILTIFDYTLGSAFEEQADPQSPPGDSTHARFTAGLRLIIAGMRAERT